MDRSLQWRRPPASLLFVAVAFLAAAVASAAAADNYDAKARALAAYHPDPIAVANSFNRAVHRSTSPRRALKGKKHQSNGPCEATNPIDRCWRCRKDWATDRMRLARCAKGFGQNTTGGLGGQIYIVTDPTDADVQNPRPGTIRFGVIQPQPIWVVFAKNMVITLTQELIINSDTTIDGRGAQVHIAKGAGLTVQNRSNVIIHNLHIHDIRHTDGGMVRDAPDHVGYRTRADGDGISLFTATNVWIDHISTSMCEDGLVDIVQSSTAITISNCHLTSHNDVMLFGASDSYPDDKIMQVTVAFTHFGRGLVQRMPRCRWGFFHVVNNDYTHWLMYAIGGSSNPTIISQGNRYIAPPNKAAKHITKRDYAPESEWKNWVWHSEDDLLMNEAVFDPTGGQVTYKFDSKKLIKPKPGTYVTRLVRYAGTLACKPGCPC